MSSIRVDKAEFHIQSESDYAIGLAHRMILTGFLSDSSREAIFKSDSESMHLEGQKVLVK
jgi:hypothetical protein